MTNDERYVVDGLDVRQEFERLLGLDVFEWNETNAAGMIVRRSLLQSKPKLQVARYARRVNKLGFARGGHTVKLNVGEGADRFDVQETLVHELTHIVMQRRFPNERIAHGPMFWVVHDRAVEEAFGPLHVAPRTNIYHGRVADALRQRHVERSADRFLIESAEVLEGVSSATLTSSLGRETFDLTQPGTRIGVLPVPLRNEPGAWGEPLSDDDPGRAAQLERERRFITKIEPEPYDRPASIGWEHMPEPIRNLKEPRNLSLSNFGIDEQPQPEPRRRLTQRTIELVPQVGTPRTSAERDEAVYRIIQRNPGLWREDIDRRYAREHGEYPGASTYNSIWRLRRNGRVHKTGRGWYVSPSH